MSYVHAIYCITCSACIHIYVKGAAIVNIIITPWPLQLHACLCHAYYTQLLKTVSKYNQGNSIHIKPQMGKTDWNTGMQSIAIKSS